MNERMRSILLFAAMTLVLAIVGFVQSWSLALAIVNLCLISAVMSLGVNIQWGYAGLFNVGVMGFAALGGVTGVLISTPPVMAAWQAGGNGIIISFFAALATILAAIFVIKKMPAGNLKRLVFIAVVIAGYFLTRNFFDPAVENIEAVEPAKTGFLGGVGLPIIFSWIAGGILAAGAAWVVGKIALGLRSDYLAIATLGISEIIVAILKNEDWLTRGVKNVSGLPRPVPYEVDLQQSPWFQDWANILGATPIEFSSIFVTGRHLQVFVLGSAVIGIAGAMLTTLDGQFTPASYQPLRFTFIIWVMVIVGGSGNNWGAVLGGFIIWFFWVEAEPMGLWLIDVLTAGMTEDNELRKHLLDSAAHMRLMTMGLILLLVLRFSPRGLIPER